jgi:hypothetical protein
MCRFGDFWQPLDSIGVLLNHMGVDSGWVFMGLAWRFSEWCSSRARTRLEQEVVRAMKKTTTSKVILTATIAAALVCLPGAASAQHGGGHGGGGGFHGGGGGGFHGGGGFGGGGFRGGSSSGGRSFGAPATRGGGSNRLSAPSNAGRPGGNVSRPGSGSFRPPTGNIAGGAGAGRDGQWHSFSAKNSAGFVRPGVGSAGAFAGGFRGFGGTGFGGGVGFRGFPGGRPGLGFGFPFQNRFGFGGFGWGGFGWGLGFGGGWGSCLGFGWTWDPFCYGSFGGWAPYPAYGYGYYGYPDPSAYPYPPDVNYDPNYSPDPSYSPDSSARYPQPSDSETPAAPSLQDPHWDTSTNVPSASVQSQVPVVIFLKDGSSFSPTDYWIADEQFHYVLGGREYLLPLSRVDLGHTNDVNHQNGGTFWLKSAPDANPAPTAVAPAAPAKDNAAPGGNAPQTATGAAPVAL